jgi:hypothetical protein
MDRVNPPENLDRTMSPHILEQIQKHHDEDIDMTPEGMLGFVDKAVKDKIDKKDMQRSIDQIDHQAEARSVLSDDDDDIEDLDFVSPYEVPDLGEVPGQFIAKAENDDEAEGEGVQDVDSPRGIEEDEIPEGDEQSE